MAHVADVNACFLNHFYLECLFCLIYWDYDFYLDKATSSKALDIIERHTGSTQGEVCAIGLELLNDISFFFRTYSFLIFAIVRFFAFLIA